METQGQRSQSSALLLEGERGMLNKRSRRPEQVDKDLIQRAAEIRCLIKKSF